jgi:hypothetical protein
MQVLPQLRRATLRFAHVLHSRLHVEDRAVCGLSVLPEHDGVKDNLQACLHLGGTVRSLEVKDFMFLRQIVRGKHLSRLTVCKT